MRISAFRRRAVPENAQPRASYARDSKISLDVLLPTYNRSKILGRALDSLLSAPVPENLKVLITVIDNNSTDDTHDTVNDYATRTGRVRYIFEKRQGRSHALNAGIAATEGDLVGMVDDDEEVDRIWYSVVSAAFTASTVDFIGGPYFPRWGAAIPNWLPRNYLGVIGWVDGGEQVRTYGSDYPGILMGGNAVIRRSMLQRVGMYSTSLGRTDKRLLSCEDEEMHHRLLAAGAIGTYLPRLIIYHYIPPERLSKRYFRNWCFWRGVSRGVMDRDHKSPVAYLGGVPRYLYGRAVRSAVDLSRSLLIRQADNPQSFSDELAWWDLAGFFYGKHFYRS
jgi:glycosyltransferase involved in cell wall biosynthesis